MSHSIYSADRATHLKIVVVGLLCAIVVAAIGIFAHVSSNIDLGTAALVKAGRPTTLGRSVRLASPPVQPGPGTASTICPLNSMGPLGIPLGEPPDGSSETE